MVRLCQTDWHKFNQTVNNQRLNFEAPVVKKYVVVESLGEFLQVRQLLKMLNTLKEKKWTTFCHKW